MTPPCHVIWFNKHQMAAFVRFQKIKALDALQKMKIWACGNINESAFHDAHTQHSAMGTSLAYSGRPGFLHFREDINYTKLAIGRL